MTNEKNVGELNRESIRILGKLYFKIYEYFTIDEMRTICFDLGIDWDEIRGSDKIGKLVSLVVHLYNRDQLEELLVLLRKERPDIDLPTPPPKPADSDAGDIFTDALGQPIIKVSQIEGELRRLQGISVSDTTLQEILHLHYPEIWTEIVQLRLYKKKLNLSDLLNKIRDAFDDSEFRDLCFALEVSYGQLAGGHYYDKARELISHCKRNGKLNDLIKLCKEQRPHIIWDYE